MTGPVAGVNVATQIRQAKWTVRTSVSIALTVSNMRVEELFEVTMDPCLDPSPTWRMFVLAR